MFERLRQQFIQQVMVKSEEGAVQPCIVKYTYTTTAEPERLYHGHKFCRDLHDGISKSQNDIDANKGTIAKLWLADFREDDPVLTMIIGVIEDDIQLPIDSDRAIAALYKNYKNTVKDPKAARKERAKQKSKQHSLRGRQYQSGEKPRVRVPINNVVVIKPQQKDEKKEPEISAYSPYDIVQAGQYEQPKVEVKALPAPSKELPAITDPHDMDPWSELMDHMYD